LSERDVSVSPRNRARHSIEQSRSGPAIESTTITNAALRALGNIQRNAIDHVLSTGRPTRVAREIRGPRVGAPFDARTTA